MMLLLDDLSSIHRTKPYATAHAFSIPREYMYCLEGPRSNAYYRMLGGGAGACWIHVGHRLRLSSVSPSLTVATSLVHDESSMHKSRYETDGIAGD